ARPLLKPSKLLKHGDGWYPYYSWKLRSLILPIREVRDRFIKSKSNQGPWGDWDIVLSSEEWSRKLEKYSDSMGIIGKAVENKKTLFSQDGLSIQQRINLLQMFYLRGQN